MTPTVTPTPPLATITFLLTIEETPIPGAPIVIDAVPLKTDIDGKVSRALTLGQRHSVETGLEAIAFESLHETGAELAARNPVKLAATRLVRADKTPCRVVVGSTTNIYFGSSNSTDRSLSVPLELNELNSIYSVTGGAFPPETFAPGASGFFIPEHHFLTPDALQGVWKFLGQTVLVPPLPEVCADTGVPGECRYLSDSQLLSPVDYTRRAILRLVREATKAARVGRWKPDGTKQTSIMILTRGARVMVKMRKLLAAKSGEKFVCDVTPRSCTAVRIPKDTLIKTFSTLYDLKFPRGIEYLKKRKQGEVTGLKAVLGGLPDTYVVCE